MIGRPGYQTMEMIGGSSASYLARTPCVPLFCTLFNRGGNRRVFRLRGADGGSFPLYGGTFAWSYSASKQETTGPPKKPKPTKKKQSDQKTSPDPKQKSGKRTRKIKKQPSLSSVAPTVREGHTHRVTTTENLGKSRGPPAEPRRDPAEPSKRPRRAL